MPARLLIYETTHHETLPAILDLAAVYFEKVTVFLREVTYQHICEMPAEQKWPHTAFCRQSEYESNRTFIRKAVEFSENNGYSHFHISTLDNNLLYFAVQLLRLRKVHLSLSIQGINEYRIFKFGDLRDLTESVAKLFFHRRITNYRFFSPKMVDVFQQHFSKVNCQFIPSRFFSGTKTAIPVQKGYLKIVIPGSITPKRRNYAFVVSFVKEQLSAIAAENAVELVLLGNINTPYGLNLVDELKDDVFPGLHIRYYLDYLSQPEYEQQLASADLFWSPLSVNTTGRRDTAEIYGLSMATGLTADLLLNCRPALVPAGFDIPEHYEDVLITYHSPSELATQIRKFICDFDDSRAARIGQSLSFFSKANFESAFEKLFSVSR